MKMLSLLGSQGSAVANCCFSVMFVVGIGTSCALAGTFNAPLTFMDETNEAGDYSSADFDFGTAFSHIDSVTLTFVMPDGYEGGGATTGNSSFFRDLRIVIHDAEELINIDFTSTDSSVSQQSSHITPQVLTTIRFTASHTICFPNQTCPQSDWPDFLESGQGRVGFVDVFHSSHHPVGAEDLWSTSTSYLSPGEIASAYLTITGTPVPEPSTMLIALCGCLVLISRRTLEF